MKFTKQISSAAAILMALAMVGLAGSETKYSTSTSATACTATFAPGSGQTVVKALVTSCDYSLGAVSFYARTGGPLTCTAVDATALTTCTVVNTSYALTNSDTVVYVYANGSAPEYRTVSAASTTYVVLSSALSSTTSASDKIYEVSLQGKITVAANGAGAGTNTLTSNLGDVFATPSDSPLYVSMQSTTNTSMNVTVSK
jgi:hypothetical protein